VAGPVTRATLFSEAILRDAHENAWAFVSLPKMITNRLSRARAQPKSHLLGGGEWLLAFVTLADTENGSVHGSSNKRDRQGRVPNVLRHRGVKEAYGASCAERYRSDG
jgi:hypothetical protein